MSPFTSSLTAPATTAGTAATAMATAMTLALLLLGVLVPLVSALAIRDTDADRVPVPALLPSRRRSPHADAGSDAAVIVVVSTTVVHTTVTDTDVDTVGIATDTGLTTSSAAPPGNGTTLFVKPTPSCDLMYCDNGTSYCIYWGGYSSYDYTEHHPIPGETRTAIGTCKRPVTPTNSYSVITGSTSATPTLVVGLADD